MADDFYSDDPNVRTLADELVDKAEKTFPFPGELDLLIGEDIAKALIGSDWLAATIRQAKAEVLREAGGEMRATPLARDEVESWLFDRAERIAAGGDH